MNEQRMTGLRQCRYGTSLKNDNGDSSEEFHKPGSRTLAQYFAYLESAVSEAMVIVSCYRFPWILSSGGGYPKNVLSRTSWLVGYPSVTQWDRGGEKVKNAEAVDGHGKATIRWGINMTVYRVYLKSQTV